MTTSDGTSTDVSTVKRFMHAAVAKGTYLYRPARHYGVVKASQGECTIGLNAANRKMLKACTHSISGGTSRGSITGYTSVSLYVDIDGTKTRKTAYYLDSDGNYKTFAPYRQDSTKTIDLGYSKATLSGNGASMVDYDGSVGVNIYCPYSTDSFSHTQGALTQAKLSLWNSADVDSYLDGDGSNVYTNTDITAAERETTQFEYTPSEGTEGNVSCYKA